MDAAGMVVGWVARAGLAFTAVWACMWPLLLVGAADWPGFLETHLAVGGISVALGVVACAAFVVVTPILWWIERGSIRPASPPSSPSSPSA